MKKVYFMAFIATAALTVMSCSNDDITTGGDLSKNEATPISFSTYLGRTAQTRGTETTTGATFGVFASYTEEKDFNTSTDKQNFMYNQQVTSSGNGTNWTYDPVKYWPTKDGDKVSFFAYAPYTDGESGNISFETVDNMTGTPQIKVTVPSDLAETTDFVAASVVNQAKTADGKVSYTLLHEMTRLSLSAAVSEDVFKSDGTHDKTYVVVKSVKLKTGSNIYTRGTYTFSDTTPSANERVTGSWTPDASASSISDLDFDKLLDKTASKVDNIEGVYLTGKTSSPLLKNAEYAFLIPVKDGVKQDDAKVVIEYAIVTIDKNLSDGHSCTEDTKELSLPAGILQQGKAYNLAFTIKVNAVELSAKPESWTEANSQESETKIDVPKTNN